MDHRCCSGGGSRVSDGERGAVVVAADIIPLVFVLRVFVLRVFVLRVVVPGCVVVVAGVEDARLPQRRPVPPCLTGICVVDPGLAVDRVHGGPSHPHSARAAKPRACRLAVPSTPPAPNRSCIPGERFPPGVFAYGSILWIMVMVTGKGASCPVLQPGLLTGG
jgi:hypothetical protein